MALTQVDLCPVEARTSPVLLHAVQGNPEALTALLKAARVVVHRWALVRIQDPDDAEDITQMVLLKLHSKLPTFRRESKLSSWLFRITVNEVAGMCRRRLSEKAKAEAWVDSGLCPSAYNPDPERIDRARTARKIRHASGSLPPLQLAAFQLVDLKGYRPCEAANELGRTQGNIRASLCRARKKIRELVAGARKDLAKDIHDS
jgi:RNA polymerase sigma-70 factor (ECF subfamily)